MYVTASHIPVGISQVPGFLPPAPIAYPADVTGTYIPSQTSIPLIPQYQFPYSTPGAPIPSVNAFPSVVQLGPVYSVAPPTAIPAESSEPAPTTSLNTLPVQQPPAESRVVYQSKLPPMPEAHLKPDVIEEEFEEDAPAFSAPALYAQPSDSLPWTVRPEKLQHEVERIQHEAAEESRRERAEAAAERARLVEEAQEAWAAYERASKKVVEIPVYKDTYRTSFSQGHFVTTLSDSPSAAAAPAESHEAVHTAVHSIGGSGSGAPQRLGLMMAGPLKGKIVPVDADGRPMADADTRAVPTAPPAPAPAAALVPAVASQPAAAAPTGHALGLLVGGPLAGQVVPVDSEGRPLTSALASAPSSSLGLLVGGPLAGQVLPVDREGRPIFSSSTTVPAAPATFQPSFSTPLLQPTALPGITAYPPSGLPAPAPQPLASAGFAPAGGYAAPSPAAPSFSTLAAAPAAPAPALGQARRVGVMMGGPLRGQVLPVDAEGRPIQF
eukprot:EG_transcript_4682